VPLELQLQVKTAAFVEITWDVGDFDEQKVLLWIVNYRIAYVLLSCCYLCLIYQHYGFSTDDYRASSLSCQWQIVTLF